MREYPMRYQAEDRLSGEVLGIFEVSCEDEALDECARSLGLSGFADSVGRVYAALAKKNLVARQLDVQTGLKLAAHVA
ncbi:MAG: hypothetical protein JWN04_5689 [Myxococcaceae bacterium]|nr:hypothetical protein [Myxococcaceae bacterium]